MKSTGPFLSVHNWEMFQFSSEPWSIPQEPDFRGWGRGYRAVVEVSDSFSFGCDYSCDLEYCSTVALKTLVHCATVVEKSILELRITGEK